MDEASTESQENQTDLGSQTWKKKKTSYLLSLRADDKKWYFNNASSRHMTSNKELLAIIELWNLSFVTFGDGFKGKVIGKYSKYA